MAEVGARERTAVTGIAAAAAFLYGWGIWDNQNRSDFYGAAVYSMSRSWHNLLYGSFDPAGSISIDKIPLSFAVQAVFVRVFGFHNWVLVLPQAIEGVLAVLVLWQVVRRWAGPAAGLLAAAVLTLTPANAALDRNTQADALLVLLLVLAADAWQRALATDRLRWLLISGAWVGVAFQAKMAQAWVVLPAFGVAWLVAAAGPVRRRLGWLALSGALTLIVSNLWVLLVTLTPAADRPYIDGSTDNSAWAMVYGYNLLTRFGLTSSLATRAGSVPNVVSGGRSALTGLLEPNMASQIAWLFPLCLVTLACGIAWRRALPRTDPIRAGFLMWGAWLLLHALVFSVGDVAHTFYVAVMAPAVAALTGAGLVMFWRALRTGADRTWALPIAVALTAAWSLDLSLDYPTFVPWLVPLLIVLALAALALLAAALLDPTHRPRLAPAAIILTALSVLTAPAVWSFSVVVPGYGGNKIGPSAGPTQTFANAGFTNGGSGNGRFRGTGGTGFRGTTPGGFAGTGPRGGAFGDTTPSAALVAYLKAHQGHARYALAVSGSNSAGPYIMAGLSVLPLGGFTGQTPYPTTTQLENLIATDQLRFVLSGGGGIGGAGSSTLTWVTTHCTEITPTGTTLYDCAAPSQS